MHLSLDSELMKNPLVVSAQQMGFHLEEIKKLMLKKIKNTGTNYTLMEVLVSDLLNSQTENGSVTPRDIGKGKGISWIFWVLHGIFSLYSHDALLQNWVTLPKEWKSQNTCICRGFRSISEQKIFVISLCTCHCNY